VSAVDASAGSVFPSRVDAWLAIIVGTAIAVPGVAIGAASAAAIGKLMIYLSGVAVFLRLLVWPCEYVLAPDHLLIRSGVLRWRVPYRDITRIEPSANPRSAPALSLRRVKISRIRGYVLVSPRDRDSFMAALRTRVDAAGRVNAREIPRS
jgi:hypothetical protein